MPDNEAVVNREAATLADADLVLRTRSGDTGAFGELWRRHYRSGITVARNISPSTDSDDLVQEAYTRIYKSIISGGGPTGSFRAYLFTSIRNTAAAWGRASRETALDTLDTVEDPATSESATNEALDRGLTHTAFRSLPSRWQEVLWYSEIEQMKPAEIAPLLGMKATAVAQLTFRAREGLREAWIQAHLQALADGSDCQWTIERLGSYSRNNIGARDRSKIDSHLKECTRCTIVAGEAHEVGNRLALVLLPITVGVAGTAGYLASLQGAGVPVLALAAMPSSVVEGAVSVSSGAPLTVVGASSNTAGAGGSGSAGGGATAGSTASAGAFSGLGATVGLVAAGVVIVAGVVTVAVALPQLASSTSASSTTQQEQQGAAVLPDISLADEPDVAVVEPESEVAAPPPVDSAPPADTDAATPDVVPSTRPETAPLTVAPETTPSQSKALGASPGASASDATAPGTSEPDISAPTEPAPSPEPTGPGSANPEPTEPATADPDPNEPTDPAPEPDPTEPTDPDGGDDTPVVDPGPSLPTGTPSFGRATATFEGPRLSLSIPISGEADAVVRVALGNTSLGDVDLDSDGSATITVRPSLLQLLSNAAFTLSYVAGDEVGVGHNVRIGDIASLRDLIDAMRS
ncbi:sigma-70 family RNA polymerase sigma factor (plasmid) [Coraliomargarita sp. W4R53]